MKANRLFAAGIFALMGLGLMAGCPATTPTATTPETPTVSAFKGTIKFGGETKSGLTLGLKQKSGTDTWQRLTTTTTSASNGTYSFKDLANGSYQALYDDGGQTVTEADVNTAGIYVTDPIEVSSTQASTPVIDFDIYWPVNPNPAPNATFTVGQSFAWSSNTNASGAQYQILVANSGKTSLWSSAWGTNNTVAWNGKQGSETSTPAGTDVTAGSYLYQIKFRKAGGTFGGGNFYGQTKWIPFTLNR
ncbi:MAG TPA: hypothetical protein DD435_14855 [Cyanobacteria bacterium UBA8530]|nr:hypothetical protein [Cyanobacteria bacterium UBA8530]